MNYFIFDNTKKITQKFSFQEDRAWEWLSKDWHCSVCKESKDKLVLIGCFAEPDYDVCNEFVCRDCITAIFNSKEWNKPDLDNILNT